jgi:DNA processing protein
MKSQSEEFLWIASQEDQLIPMEIIKFAVENRISLSELLDYDQQDLPHISAKSISLFLENRDKIDVNKCQNIWDKIQEQKIRVITYDDPLFPQYLRDLPSNRTVLLYHKGKELSFQNCVAIVGTRNCSTKASEFARELSMQVAEKDYTVVAGLALGIDAIAHRGALKTGGKTIAVLPWMYNPPPQVHKQLLSEIQESGASISEVFFSSGTYMDRIKFVQRNTIISGISDVLIAVESSITGGTIRQVEIATRQQKTVVVVEPEKENKSAYDGFEKFVELGAIPSTSIEQILHIIEKTVEEKNKKPITTLISEY